MKIHKPSFTQEITRFLDPKTVAKVMSVKCHTKKGRTEVAGIIKFEAKRLKLPLKKYDDRVVSVGPKFFSLDLK